MNIPDKALKCLNLALNGSAPEGEWNSAAIRFCSILRKNGIGVEFLTEDKDRPPPNEGKPSRNKRRESKSNDTVVTMPFGKFKGEAITDIPDWYLDWCIEQDFIKDRLRTILEQEFERRNPPDTF